ncbi:hypothetical protein JW960_11845 [candidate division KSB1 bacterium]|nr:hypothetical protein [candidate division KSB1 bacterium]
MNYKTIVLCVCLLMLSGKQALAQNKAEPGAPLEHEKRFFIDPEQNIYVAASLPVFLYISTSPVPTRQTHQLKDNQKNLTSFLLKEGKNYIQSQATDLKTKGGDDDIRFPVIADGTAPATELVFSSAKRYVKDGTIFYGPNVVVDLRSTDNLSGLQERYLSVNSSEFKPFTTALSNFNKNNDYDFRYYSVDNVGNAETVKQEKFSIDVSPPVSELSLEGTHEWDVLSPDAGINLQSSDNSSGVKEILYQIDDGEKLAFQNQIKLNDLSNGAHTLTYFAVDYVENQEAERTYEFYVDKQAPDVVSTVEGDQHQDKHTIYVSTRSRIKLEVADDKAGIESIRYKINNDEEKIYTNPITLPFKNGVHKISFSGVDMVKNTSKSRDVKYFLDMVAPKSGYDFTGSTFKDGDVFVINKSTKIKLTTSDLESGVKTLFYRVNGQDEQVYTEPFTLENDGEYTLAFYAVDQVQNKEEIHAIDIRVDNSPRQVNRTAIPLSQTKRYYVNSSNLLTGARSLPVYLRIAASPEDTARSYLLDVNKASKIEFPLTFPRDGINYLIASIDGSNPTVYQVFADAVAPKTTIKFQNARSYTQRDSVYYDMNLQIQLSSEDKESGVETIFFSVDGSDFLKYREPLTNFSREKSYFYRYYAADSVGNTEPEKKAEFIIDMTPPKTSHQIAGSYYGTILSPQASIILDCSDNLSGVQSIKYRFDDGEFQSYTGPLGEKQLKTLKNGDHKITYFARDQVGNEEEQKEFEFQFDNTAPELTLDIVGDEYKSNAKHYVSSRTQFRIAAQDQNVEVKEIITRIDNAEATVYTKKLRLPEQAGDHTITYYSSDILENTGAHQSMRVYLDITAPTSNHEISDPQFQKAEKLCINPTTAITLTATDKESGLKEIYFRIGSGQYHKYAEPIHINSHGLQKIEYYAVDKVNNQEAKKSFEVFVDKTPPRIEISYSIKPKEDPASGITFIPNNSLIYIKAVDSENEVERITYSINGDEEKLYRSPLTNFKKGEQLNIRVSAIDRLSNKGEEKIQIFVK